MRGESFWSLFRAGRLRSIGDFFAALRGARLADQGVSLTPDRFFDPDPEQPVFVAPQTLRMGPGYFTSDRYLAQGMRADWQHCHPDIVRFAAHFIEAMRKRGVPLYVHGAFRSEADQDAAVAAGRSKAVWPVAAHAQGAAVDIVHSDLHWEMSRQEWQFLGKVGKDLAARLGVAVEWGGDWKFYDPAHWAIVGWKSDIRRLVAGPPVHVMPRALLGRV